MTRDRNNRNSPRRGATRGLRLAALALVAVATALVPQSPAAADHPYLIGRGVADITGPAVGVQMFGFVRADQISEGLHLRLAARAFVVAEPGAGGKRVAFVVADLGSVTHELHRSVVEKLAAKHGDLYTVENTIVSATHTHCGPGGFWHYGANTPVGGPFYKEHFDAIVDGIVAAIEAAHADLSPGSIFVAEGEVEGAGANRSLVAYMNNPEAERARYDSDMDKRMTLLKFADDSGAIGSLNWFAVHPTAMTFFNRLISSDHKGYAAMTLEARLRARDGISKDGPFLAGFAQTNCGDVTPNLNLNNTGPGKDEFETTKIIGTRQLEKAAELFDAATERVEGPIDFRFGYVDFSAVEVAEEFAGEPGARTWPAAYGYSFAAGSTEDGGGHPLFKEGMTKRNPMIDGMVQQFAPLPTPTDELRAAHLPKAILFAPGAADPPATAKVLPLSVVRIGSLALVVGPSEYTTMSGRRIREAVAKRLEGVGVKRVVVAGYSNGFAGYVTTHEEYLTQQYEGGHTVFGPWTEAAHRQEFCRLAEALAKGEPADRGPEPHDPRPETKAAELGSGPDKDAEGKVFGDVSVQPAESYARGAVAEAEFVSGDPSNDFRTGGSYCAVEREEGGAWVPVANDAAWETKIRWRDPVEVKPTATPQTVALVAPPARKVSRAIVSWEIPPDAATGSYRLVHFGTRLTDAGEIERFEARSNPFAVTE